MNDVQGSGDPICPLGLYSGLTRRRPLPWERFPSLSPNEEEPFFPTLVGGRKTLNDFLTSPRLDVYPAIFVVYGFEKVEKLLEGDIPIAAQMPQGSNAGNDSPGM